MAKFCQHLYSISIELFAEQQGDVMVCISIGKSLFLYDLYLLWSRQGILYSLAADYLHSQTVLLVVLVSVKSTSK